MVLSSLPKVILDVSRLLEEDGSRKKKGRKKKKKVRKGKERNHVYVKR